MKSEREKKRRAKVESEGLKIKLTWAAWVLGMPDNEHCHFQSTDKTVC
jgi:hypothetical protein